MRSLTTEKIIELFNIKHNSKYTYPNFKSATLQDKIKIVCPIHGDFQKYGYCHLSRGEGCKKCSKLGLPRYTHEQFVKTLKDFHGEVLPFKILSQYIGNKDNILIEDKYGVCLTKAYNLSGRHYSSLRTAVDKTAYMINKFKEVHGDNYNYTDYIYNGNRQFGIINCKIHQSYQQMTDVHLMGSGCPKCALGNKSGGWGRTNFIKNCGSNKATMYIIECYNDSESFIKFGITKNTVKDRYKGNYEMPYKYKVLFIKVGEPSDVWDLELSIMQKFRNTYSNTPNIYFKGITECLSILCKKELINFVK